MAKKAFGFDGSPNKATLAELLAEKRTNQDIL